MSKTEKFTIANLNPSAYTFKIKNSERRMKMYIKLTQAETEGWNAVKNAITAGQDISDDNLAKLLFFRGLNNIMDELNKQVSEMTEEEKAAAMNEYEQSIKDEPTREEVASPSKGDSEPPKQDFGVLGDELMGSQIITQVAPQDLILPK
tara:strand:- start:1511 stop:1957 length:447 start_codon:yes stop_codon:yes gene_type:complete